MTSAPTPPPHTPMMLVKAGGFDMSDEACDKALAACGLDPKAFDSYSGLSESQKDARAELGRRARGETGSDPPFSKPHVAPCELGPGQAQSGQARCFCFQSPEARAASTANEGLLADAEAGHLGRDQLAHGGNRSAGADPCMNYPPPMSGSAHSGTYGYSLTGAPCMPHFGSSTDQGSPHANVCRTEAAHIQQLPGGPGAPVPAALIEDGVRRSATTAVTGRAVTVDPTTGNLQVLPEQSPAAAQVQSGFQQRQVDAASELTQGAAGTGPGTSDTANSGPLTKEQEHAIECIVAKWKKGIAEMQNESVRRYGPGNAQANERAAQALAADRGHYTPWDQLSPEDQRRAVEARQRELAVAGTANNPFPSAGGSQQRADCREYQANWLWLHGNGPTGNQTFPPMQGQVPGGAVNAPPSTGAIELAP